MPEQPDALTEAYEAALTASGIADVRPIYRQFLRRLKAQDSERYETAVSRYETDVVGGEPTDPLKVWIGYGAWLASSLSPGHLIAIDASGRAEKASGSFPVGPLLVHLPESKGERGLPVAIPESPSRAQEAAQKILCG